jgi:hypothetical protein
MYSNIQYFKVYQNPLVAHDNNPFNIQDHLALLQYSNNPFFRYMFSAIIACLIIKIIIAMQFNSTIGPLVKVVQKMAGEFMNFLLFYLILTLMIVMIGNIMFQFYCPTYQTLFTTFVTLTNASLGNFNYSDFDSISSLNI